MINVKTFEHCNVWKIICKQILTCMSIFVYNLFMGYIHVYTGNGKGKTTAAIGLAIRAVGAGKKVFIAQFVKGMRYSELNSLSKIENITIKQYGLDCFIYKEPTQADIDIAQEGLNTVSKIIKKNNIIKM